MAITRVRRRSFAERLVHGGAALAMPKFVHRESIGRLKKPRGTVAHFIFCFKDGIECANKCLKKYSESTQIPLGSCSDSIYARLQSNSLKTRTIY